MMAELPRFRSRTVFDHGSVNGQSVGFIKTRQSFTDVTDLPGYDHMCRNVKQTLEGSVGNGMAYFSHYDNYPSGMSIDQFPMPIPSFSMSPYEAYSKMVAGTAPHRAEWNSLAFLAELKDVPGLLRDGFSFCRWLLTHTDAFFDPDRKRWKRPSTRIRPEKVLAGVGYLNKNSVLYARQIAKANLAIQFGFMPFINDVLAAANVSNSMERRRREFSKLSDKGRLTRRWTFDSVSSDESFVEHDVLLSNTGEHVGTRHHVLTGRMWGTVTWTPGANTLFPKNDAELTAMMLGLNAGGMLEASWEAMPWSWFVDYFTNVGDIVSATANGIQYNVHGCIMEETTLTVTHPSSYRSVPPFIEHSLSAGTLTKKSFARHAFGDIPGFIVLGDMLRPQQLSILASLTAVKA